MADLRSHQISFSFHSDVRKAILEWVSLVKKFTEDFTEDASTTRDLAGAALVLHNLDKNLMHLDNVVEGMAVHHTVQLTANLSHTSEMVRINCVALLIQLAVILDAKNADSYKKRQEKLVAAFQTADRGKEDD
jgi:hypothetical protein